MFLLPQLALAELRKAVSTSAGKITCVYVCACIAWATHTCTQKQY